MRYFYYTRSDNKTYDIKLCFYFYEIKSTTGSFSNQSKLIVDLKKLTETNTSSYTQITKFAARIAGDSDTELSDNDYTYTIDGYKVAIVINDNTLTAVFKKDDLLANINLGQTYYMAYSNNIPVCQSDAITYSK